MVLKRLNEIDDELDKLGPIPEEHEIAELISRYCGDSPDADKLDAELAKLASSGQISDRS